jgi:putative addiction module killer protein
MYLIEKTDEFDKWLRKLKDIREWLRKLKDIRAKAIILFRIQKVENLGQLGNCESVGQGIRELKIDYAKGYRIYFKEKEGKIIILLVGGDKSTQRKDIEKAKEILKRIKN